MGKKIKARYGKLSVTDQVENGGDLLYVCKCECGQVLIAAANELKLRKSCRACEARTAFKPDDIAVFKNAIGGIPFGEQVLIRCANGNIFEVEYCGKRYHCRADELEPLGVNFFDPVGSIWRKLKIKCRIKKKK